MFSGKFNLIFSEILMFNFTSSTDSDCTNDYKYLCTSNLMNNETLMPIILVRYLKVVNCIIFSYL